MRKDEEGNECPATLGEYLDLAEAIGIPDNTAAAFLRRKIENSSNGRDEIVVAPDSQMRALLVPMMLREEPAAVRQK